MKVRSIWTAGFVFSLLLGVAARGQSDPGGFSTNAVGTNSVSTGYAITSLGGSYRVWQKTVPAYTNQSGQTVFRTNSYTEMATGLNRLSGNQWTAADETIQITANGGVASNGQHQVAFAGNISTPNAVQITTPDGQNLQTHILGLSYYDSSTGTNILFATLTNATGFLVKSNRVVYSNAFTGCQADVRYTYRRSGIEQDIILDSQPPALGSLGLNPQTTWLQIWTEFVNQPTPTVTPVQNGTDVRVEFGTMYMGSGRGFMLGNPQNSVPVTKQWVTTQGRTFLVEQVPFQNLASQLQTLPTGSGGSSNGVQQIKYQGFPAKLPPLPTLAKNPVKMLKLAKASLPNKKGLVLDYLLTLDSDQDNFTFQGDTTYDITGVLNMSDTTTIEGGAVLKFYDDGGDPSDGPSSSLVIDGNLVCATGPYQMAMLTSENDDSVGEQITGSTGSPTTATDNCYISWDSENPAVLNYLRFAFAYTGFGIGNNADVWNCQLVDCYYSEMIQSTSETDLHNVLFSGGNTAVYYAAYATTAGEQITSDCSKFIDYDPFVYDASYYSYLYLTNSVIEGTLNPPSNLNTNKVALDPAGTVFQTAGAGNYYLAAGTYRGIGTTNLSAGMLAELAQKTTYPPVCPTSFTADVVPTLTTNTTLGPAIPRDTNAPDLGYLYDPIDYMTTCDYSNCVVTMTNGVVLGYWRNLGISLNNSSQLVSQGTPLQPNIIAYFSLVQEQPVKLMASDPDTSDYPANTLPIATYHGNTSLDPSVSLRFTAIYAPQVANNIMYTYYTFGNYAVDNLTLRDCEIFGAGAEENWLGETGSVSLINNLFQYTPVYVNANSNIGVYNNLYRGTSGYEFHIYSGAASITNRNNAFDGASVDLAGTMGYNAYLNGATDLNSAQSGDVTTSMGWVAGPLGNFYQATNSPLTNAGSITADALGLFDYTTHTTEVKQTNAVVDIGYHYVALGTNGFPLQTYGLGAPDYMADEGLPAWELKYFGQFGMNPAGSFDNDGTNNLYKYLNGIDPNVIQFFYSVPNEYVQTNLVSGAITVLAGVPSNMAVLVDSTNFSGATWSNYTSTNLTVNIGTNQGEHDIWVGMRGLPSDAQQTWQETSVILDTVTPTISITNPVNNVTFNSSRVNVSGTFSAGWLEQITVNGVVAFTNGSSYEAVNVPLNPGTNSIAAIITDINGSTNLATINVITTTNTDGSLNDPVQLSASPVAGFYPLTVTFNATNNAPGTFQKIYYDFVGDDQPGSTNTSISTLTNVYSTNGQFFPVVTVQTTAGRFSSLGGWNFFNPQFIIVNVEPFPALVTNISITDPVDLKWTASSNLYVLSESPGEITEFDTNDNTVRSLSSIGGSPTGLDVDSSGRVYVALSASNQVWRFIPTNSTFQVDASFGSSGFIGETNGSTGTGNGQFNTPYDVAISPDGGTVSVSDSGNNQVQQFDANGNFITLFGGFGTALGQFNAPKGLTYDSSSVLYVVDSSNNRVVLVHGSTISSATGSSGSDLTEFSLPAHCDAGERGIFVADTGNNRIQAFFRYVSDTFSSADIRFAFSASFNAPNAVVTRDNLTNEMFYVADTGNNRVALYQQSGDDPTPAWNAMTNLIVSGNIQSAITNFSITSTDDFRDMFLATGIGPTISTIGQDGPLIPVYVYSDQAEYYFTQTIDGQDIGIIIDFVKENGVWRILEF